MTNQRNLDLLRRWARIFDSAFRIPGTNVRFGIDPILGLVPGIGDLASPVLSLFMIWQGARMHVPKIVLARMVFNALIDGVSGVVPVVGDLFDFGWKATEWNLALLERHAMPGQRATSFDYVFVILCSAVIVVVAVLPLLLVWWGFAWLDQALRGRT
ncbi:MAG TPA: DUF4112 domain-containing protein [Vicinamibacterales bacterium]|nr:DUF4112 domain-containing protein [Vicinamibacterales bacterium]